MKSAAQTVLVKQFCIVGHGLSGMVVGHGCCPWFLSYEGESVVRVDSARYRFTDYSESQLR